MTHPSFNRYRECHALSSLLDWRARVEHVSRNPSDVKCEGTSYGRRRCFNSTATSCEKRHFVHDTRATDETIIAVLHNDGNGIVVDISPKAQNIETQQCYTSLFEAFCHLDEQFFDKAM